MDDHGVTWGLRCSPSGGALYPLDVYCVVQHALDVEPGVHSYDPAAHALQLLQPGLLAEELAAATFLGDTVQRASVLVLLAANFSRTKFKYGERGYRFALLEAGHVTQNLLLSAESLGLGALPPGRIRG